MINNRCVLLRGTLLLMLCFALPFEAQKAVPEGERKRPPEKSTAAGERKGAELKGKLVDPEGRALEGATITITNKRTGSISTLRTESDGEFSAALLAPGSYRISGKHERFKQWQTEIQVNPGMQRMEILQQVIPEAEPPPKPKPKPKSPKSEPPKGGLEQTLSYG